MTAYTEEQELALAAIDVAFKDHVAGLFMKIMAGLIGRDDAAGEYKIACQTRTAMRDIVGGGA
jgi:hypothetical protein